MMNHRRRRETRVYINLYIPIRKICFMDRKVINLDKVLPVTTENLSANGVLLYSQLNFPLTIKLFLNLPIGQELIPCVADIVRKEARDSGYYYGCRLEFINDGDIAKVRRFVLGKQVEMSRCRKVDAR